jgi:DnaJ-class molecular chaperone
MIPGTKPEARDPCDICNGWGALRTGNDPQTYRECGTCEGTGERVDHEMSDYEIKLERR